MFAASEEWKARYPDACFGVLIMEGVDNTGKCPALEERKDALEQSLRTLYAGKSRKEIGAEHPFASYGRYYKTFGKNYHVLFQVESVALKEKPIFSPSPLVAVMFMAELKNLLLSAVHDLDKLKTPLFLKTAAGDESYTAMGGREVTNIPGDFLISDQEAVFSSILRGPDQRSAISADTSRAIFMIYAPAGVEAALVADHLRDIEAYVRLASPDAVTNMFEVRTY